MKKQTRWMITMALAAAALTGGINSSSYAADETPVYTLNPITVTATRYEKKDVDIGASTQTFTAKEIEQTGADNMYAALQYLDGVVTSGMGPNGAANGSMTSKLVIRGVDSGTVVMVNGTPINWRSLYNLENISPSSVEKVEIVRGGGAVLYGSQATGGVINIITKKVLPNEVKVGLGDKSKQDYSVSAHAGKASIAYHYNKWGNMGLISNYETVLNTKSSTPAHMKQNYLGSEKNDLMLSYKFNDNVDVLYNHNKSVNRWEYKYYDITDPNESYRNGDIKYAKKFEYEKDFLQVNFKNDNGLAGHVFYNRNTMDTHAINYYGNMGTKNDVKNKVPQLKHDKETNNSYGYDIQKIWMQGTQTFLLGSSIIRETYETSGSSYKDYGRNIYSIFGSWDKTLTEKDSLTIGGRGTWTQGGPMTFHNFSGQAQYLHKINDSQSLYASAGQSFVLPTFSQMYSKSDNEGSIIGNSELRPQKGTHYELGWKAETPNRSYKLALFTEKIKDKISFVRTQEPDTKKYFYNSTNEDFKNKGIEFSVKSAETNGFGWNAGVTLQDPETKQTTARLMKKGYWDHAYGKFLLNGGVTYNQDKWSTALNFTYLANRVMTPSDKHSYDMKPYLLTSFSAKYSPNKISDVILTVENIFNREDVVSHTTSYYYSTPRNFMLSYRYKF